MGVKRGLCTSIEDTWTLWAYLLREKRGLPGQTPVLFCRGWTSCQENNKTKAGIGTSGGGMTSFPQQTSEGGGGGWRALGALGALAIEWMASKKYPNFYIFTTQTVFPKSLKLMNSGSEI